MMSLQEELNLCVVEAHHATNTVHQLLKGKLCTVTEPCYPLNPTIEYEIVAAKIDAGLYASRILVYVVMKGSAPDKPTTAVNFANVKLIS